MNDSNLGRGGAGDGQRAPAAEVPIRKQKFRAPAESPARRAAADAAAIAAALREMEEINRIVGLRAALFAEVSRS